MGLKNTYQTRKRFTKVPVSKTGMWYQDRDVVVPSNQITMKGPNGESDYFSSPIMGTGMQSGQTQVMYPGREYSFPNDNSVYETKMQSGGISGNSELALDLASMIPGPVGMMASGLGLFNDLYQGDWVGAGLNTANILTGGTSKGLMSVARLASNAGARNAANVLAAGSRNLNRTSRIVNNYTKPVDTTRNVLNPSATYSTEFGGYEDNNRKNIPTRPDWYTTEDWDRSVDQYNYRNRPKMQSGGLFPVGPYDEMMAPKQGNYLQPDINRPYYIDDFGGMRSEYKMGFNDNGKETLIPTVVNGRQLTEDQAINNYFRTGLHMGKYNSVDDAEYASKMRTAKYNMFQDPIRFQMQIGGETSTANNPLRMNPVVKKTKMPKVDWYESIDPRNWNLRDYSAVDDYGTAYQRAKLSGQDKFYWKGKRYNTKYAGPINEEIATYGVKGQKVNSKDYITVYQYPYLDRDYLPSHIAADQSAQIVKLYNTSFEDSDSDWDKSEKFYDYIQTQIQPNTPYRTRNNEESLIYYPPTINYGPYGNMRRIKDDMSLSGRKEYRVYGVDPVNFFKKSQELDREVYKSIGYNWNLVTNNCADNMCDAFGVPRDKFITTPQDAIEKISKKYPTLEVTGRKTYQDGGERSTEDNPVRMNPIDIQAPQRSWFDRNIERPLRKWGRSYAQRISDQTGGSEWYKQPNSVASAFFSTGPGFVTEAPQLSATYAATGKVQTPSEAMDIQNPYGAFALDAILDPTNLLGAGLLKQPLKNLGRNIVNSPNNIGNAKLSDELVDINSLFSEGIGELIAGRKNRKALSKGNTWLKNWIADPITQNKIENDLGWASQRNDQYGLGYQQAKSFVPNVREYPLSEQMKDFFIRQEGSIHADNSGVSYLHYEKPINRQKRLLGVWSDIAPSMNMRYYGSWVSRNPVIEQSVRKSSVIHEGTHDWTTNFLLNNSGQADAIKNIYSDKIKNISEEWQNLRNQGISPSQVMGKQNADLGYLADPTEVHARIMELRQLMKMTPEQSVMVTPEKAQDIIRRIENPKNAKFIDPKFLDVIDKDPKKLAALFNRLWAATAATALGASQLQEKKYGGLQMSYLKTKRFK